ncbi:hypothetical protein [Streptomyces sp. NPDC017202]|uniref:hypothetical protein n=1 Tax=Streptomyces sp. NPDC017202 TaxID=3364981 RepID=UPI0037AC362A
MVDMWMVATLWHIAVTIVFGAGQFSVERPYARGSARALPSTPPRRLGLRLAALRARSARATAPEARPAVDGGR